MTTRTRIGGIILAVAAIIITVIGLAPSPTAARDVCPPGDSGKIDTTGDPLAVEVTAPAGYVIVGYCVKAGSSSSSAGTHLELVDPPTPSVTITHPSGKAVSHYSIDWKKVPPSSTTTTTTTTTTTAPPASSTTTTTAPPTSSSSTSTSVAVPPPPTVPPATAPPTVPPATTPPTTPPDVTTPPTATTPPPPAPTPTIPPPPPPADPPPADPTPELPTIPPPPPAEPPPADPTPELPATGLNWHLAGLAVMLVAVGLGALLIAHNRPNETAQ